MLPLEEKVTEAIARHEMLVNDRPVCVAVSGGADSVALLASLKSLGYECVALHCNFHLRGEESNRDERHTLSVSAMLEVPCEVCHFDIPAYRLEHGGSVEMACRAVRYEWFEKRRSALGAQAVAVAHNASDSEETFFLNLLRGTSLAGLTGIKAVCHGGRVVRPLLGITRREIEEYLADRGIGYVTDSTNKENDFLRNKLRNVVLPALCAQFPDADRGIARTMELLGMNYDFYRQAVSDAISSYILPGGDVDLISLSGNDNAFIILYEYLRQFGFSATQVKDMLECASESGRIFKGAEKTVIVDRGILKEISSEPEPSMASLEINVHPASEFSPEKGCATVAYFDASILEGEPLTVRSWREGDRIRPYGMKGTRKVSDIFSDAKVSVDRKRRIPILVKGDEILWVVGLRASALYPVTPSSEKFVRVSLK